MNNANKRMRSRSGVDLVNATMLLLKMESKRHNRQKECVSRWNGILTPKGSQICTEVLERMKEMNEQFTVHVTNVNEDPGHYECHVRNSRGCVHVLEIAHEATYGFYENTCTCGEIEVGGVPCAHVMAVVKSKTITHLMPTNVMPWCWSRETWKKQFTQNTPVVVDDLDMAYLKMKYAANNNVCYMPDFVAKRKRGRPKESKRYKSALEIVLAKNSNKKKRRKVTDDDVLGPDDFEFGFTVQQAELVVGDMAWV